MDAVSEFAGGLPFNGLDYVIGAVVLVSAILAYYRGFVREVLAIASWVGAALGAIRLFPLAQPYTQRWIEVAWIADLVTAVAVFVVILVALWLITHAIAVRVKGSPLNPLDRSLGFAFGILRGIVLVALVYMVAIRAAWEDQAAPQWVTEAKALPVIDYAAGLIVALVPEGTFNLPVEGFETIQKKNDELQQAKQTIETLKRYIDPPVAPAAGAPADGEYRDSDRAAIRKLLESLSEPGSEASEGER